LSNSFILSLPLVARNLGDRGKLIARITGERQHRLAFLDVHVIGDVGEADLR
jgi:hypothetical protein